MAGTNDHTGARLVTKPTSKAYEENFDKVFPPKKQSPCQNHDCCQEDTKVEKDPSASFETVEKQERAAYYWVLGGNG